MASQSYAASAVWVTNEKDWMSHCQGHLEKLELAPTQCNPFEYGGCLASPGYCPFCLGNVDLPATIRMHQVLDRNIWREHIHQQIMNLEVPVCPHPRTQCTESFESMQELKYHLVNVHCVELKKGSKRSSPENEVHTRPPKVKRTSSIALRNYKMEVEAYRKQGYKFVNEGTKFWSQDSMKD